MTWPGLAALLPLALKAELPLPAIAELVMSTVETQYPVSKHSEAINNYRSNNRSNKTTCFLLLTIRFANQPKKPNIRIFNFFVPGG